MSALNAQQELDAQFRGFLAGLHNASNRSVDQYQRFVREFHRLYPHNPRHLWNLASDHTKVLDDLELNAMHDKQCRSALNTLSASTWLLTATALERHFHPANWRSRCFLTNLSRWQKWSELSFDDALVYIHNATRKRSRRAVGQRVDIVTPADIEKASQEERKSRETMSRSPSEMPSPTRSPPAEPALGTTSTSVPSSHEGPSQPIRPDMGPDRSNPIGDVAPDTPERPQACSQPLSDPLEVSRLSNPSASSGTSSQRRLKRRLDDLDMEDLERDIENLEIAQTALNNIPVQFFKPTYVEQVARDLQWLKRLKIELELRIELELKKA
ncbi:hypothetical protein F5Y04DRAFT_166009 [Hypomontagnella monticulosa]|nr:hypothetical protein F5Y04DRAFT_166009 [Hypomontagnella monticulosa]